MNTYTYQKFKEWFFQGRYFRFVSTNKKILLPNPENMGREEEWKISLINQNQNHELTNSSSSLRKKSPNTEFFASLNTVKYGPEKTPYLDTFHAVHHSKKVIVNFDQLEIINHQNF